MTKLIIGITSISYTLAFKYYYQKGMLESINKKLLNTLDNCCNELISVGAYEAFELDSEGFPILLRKELKRFGNELIKCFSNKELFRNITGGIFYLKSENLPTHEVTIHPESIRHYYTTEFKEAIEFYVYHEKRNMSLIITASHDYRVKDVKLADKNQIDLHSKSGYKIEYNQLMLPSDYCTITPININNQPLGYFALFYEKPPPVTSWYHMEPLIDVFIIEKLENWKIDDVIKSMFEREVLLYAIFMIMRLDNFSNRLDSDRKFAKKRDLIMNRIAEEFSKYMFSPVSYLHVEDEIFIHSKTSAEETDIVRNRVIPKIAQQLIEQSYDKRQPHQCDIASLGLDVNLKNNHIIYVPIKFKESNDGSNKEHYYGHFGLLREKEYNEFDLFMLSILEESKLDNIIKVLCN
ncbi:hypothetical protein GF337_11830 [candidate division KSB1 bacterium]|nr:hypothetical protein [candidate division KSB1 bacterium]